MPAKRIGIAAALVITVSVFITANLLNASTVRAQDINLYVNGVQTLFPDQLPYIDENDCTMVPVRFCSLALGATVDWDPDKMQVTISSRGTAEQPSRQATLTIDSKDMLVDSYKTQEIGAAAALKNGRTMVPVRFISEFFGYQVVWNAPSRTVHIFTEGQTSEEQTGIITAAAMAGAELPHLNSAENLERLLDEYGPNYRSKEGNGLMNHKAVKATEQAALSAPTDSMAAVSTEDYSGTNLQVEGVDESDIVKTDGEYLYQIKEHSLIIVKACPADELKVVSQVPLLQHPREMYIDHNRLVLIQDAPVFYHDPQPVPLDNAAKRLIPSPVHNQTLVTVFDTTDKNNPVKTDEYRTPGYYLSSRKIGSNVYVISNAPVYQPFEPVYFINDQQFTKTYQQISYFPDMQLNAYVSIAQVQLGSPGNNFALDTFLGSSDNVYCSQNNLYIAASHYHSAYYREDGPNTVVYKFALGDKVNYAERGLIPGTILNQFSMDEYDGYFRIATTTDSFNANQSGNAVYILDSKMKRISAIENIAPGERIYSARFMGPRAYLVTFKEIDPLFVIDMNPTDPRILGKLKIPGFSNYLHPYGEHYLIGLGSEVEETGKLTRTTGVKLSLFDVADVSNPLEVGKTVIGTSGTYSPATDNHKAFMIHQDLLAFPVTVYEGNAGYDSFAFQGAYVYNISPQGFTLQGRITHLTQQDYLKAGDYWGYHNKLDIQRLVYIQGNIYTLSESVIKANQKGTLTEINCILTD